MLKQIQKNSTATATATAIAIPMPVTSIMAERIIALAFTLIALLVSVEMFIQHNPWSDKQHGYGNVQSSNTELFARAEGKGEAARLPEEFDIGLQTPHVTGI